MLLGRLGGRAVPGREPDELAYMDMGKGKGRAGSRSAWVPPVWPVPDDDPAGLVWIADDIGDPVTQQDGLFELVDEQLVEVVTFAGPGLRAHWSRSVRDGELEWTPTLLFRSMRAAVAWAQTVTSEIVIDLHDTEPAGTYQMGHIIRRFPEAPEGLVDEWDRRYGLAE